MAPVTGGEGGVGKELEEVKTYLFMGSVGARGGGRVVADVQ